LEDVRATHRLNNTSIRSVRNEFHSPALTALEEQDNDILVDQLTGERLNSSFVVFN
jgi:hypothetical protein